MIKVDEINEQWIKEEVREIMFNNYEYVKDDGEIWIKEYPYLGAAFRDYNNISVLKELYDFVEHGRTQRFIGITGNRQIVFSLTVDYLLSVLEMRTGYKLKTEKIKLTLAQLNRIGFITLHSPNYFSGTKNEGIDTFYFSIEYLCGNGLDYYNQVLKLEANSYFYTPLVFRTL